MDACMTQRLGHPLITHVVGHVVAETSELGVVHGDVSVQ
jgi:hypothetical protein